MNEESCRTCNNPIGGSLKALRDERDRLIPFITQNRPKRDEFLRWEKEIKERADRATAYEEEVRSREQQLERNEAAFDELLKEARRPAEEFDLLERKVQELMDQIESATAEHKTALESVIAEHQAALASATAGHQAALESAIADHQAAFESATVKHQAAVRKLTNSIESERAKTLAEKSFRESVEQVVSQLRGELAVSLKDRIRLTHDYDSLAARRSELASRCDRATSEIAVLKVEKQDLTAKKLAIETEVFALRRTNAQLTTANDLLNHKIGGLQVNSALRNAEKPRVSSSGGLFDLDLVHALSQEIVDFFAPPDEITCLGSGPFLKGKFNDYLKSLGITPRSSGCPWIIVGRNGWTEEQLDDLLDDADLEEVRVFSQELFLVGILTTHDVFSLPTDILMKFAQGHPALEYLIESGFEWPETFVEQDFGDPLYLRGSFEGVEESPLYRMGYQVGLTNGSSSSVRRALLKDAYRGVIPVVDDPAYMEEWGRPRQSRRLWRVAHHIAWLIRSRRANPTMRYAVKDWQDDLAWLQKQFYTKRMRFKWPRS